MKSEINVKIYHKGMEYSINGGPCKKAELLPPIVDSWLPLAECSSVMFEVGRKQFLMTLERVHKGKKHGRS